MKNVILEPTIRLIQRVLILLLATFMFALGWNISAIKPVLEHKDCVTVLINVKENKLIEVLNESFVTIVYEVEQSMAGQYRNWIITINETNHNKMPETQTSSVITNGRGKSFEMNVVTNDENVASEKERKRWFNYFSWMDYTNSQGTTNK
jgi:hypothetical protein